MKTENPEDVNDENQAISLTKREYFAASILGGLMSLPGDMDDRFARCKQAVEFADTLILALEKK